MKNIDQEKGVREFYAPDHLDSQSKVSNQDKGNSSTPNTHHWYF